MEDLRQAVAAANNAGAKGSLEGQRQSYTLDANDQILQAKQYETIIVAWRNKAPVMLRDVAKVSDGLENARVGGWYNGEQSIVLDVMRQPGANIIATVELVKQALPKLHSELPAGMRLDIVNDRTDTIRASIHEVQMTLVIAAGLVVAVVLMFLRSWRATLIAGVSLPLSIIATFFVMWAMGFSLDNLSLMALTIGTGFIVDDAIVMIENIFRNIEHGKKPLQAALDGAREIGFTVVSLTVSLIAVFIPLLFMTGIVGPHVPRIRADAVDRRDHFGGHLADADAHALRRAAAHGAGAHPFDMGNHVAVARPQILPLARLGARRISASCSFSPAPRWR